MKFILTLSLKVGIITTILYCFRNHNPLTALTTRILKMSNDLKEKVVKSVEENFQLLQVYHQQLLDALETLTRKETQCKVKKDEFQEMKTKFFENEEDFDDHDIIKLNIGGKYIDIRYSVFKESCLRDTLFCEIFKKKWSKFLLKDRKKGRIYLD
jgi:hypothetical protein